MDETGVKTSAEKPLKLFPQEVKSKLECSDQLKRVRLNRHLLLQCKSQICSTLLYAWQKKEDQ
jgi:hypothetical protein